MMRALLTSLALVFASGNLIAAEELEPVKASKVERVEVYPSEYELTGVRQRLQLHREHRRHAHVVQVHVARLQRLVERIELQQSDAVRVSETGRRGKSRKCVAILQCRRTSANCPSRTRSAPPEASLPCTIPLQSYAHRCST